MIIYTSEKKYLPYVNAAAQKYKIPAALILGHMKQESAFDPKAYRAEPAINDASLGLMQVLVRTAQSIDPNATSNELLNPEYNIDIGSAYIAQNLQRYGNNVKDAIAAYNSGIVRKNGNGQYVNSKGSTSVQNYVDKVYKNYLDYESWLSSGADSVSLSNIDPLMVVLFVGLGISFFFIRRHYANKRR